MKRFSKNSFTAFTLAEVLITLGIIGVIAAFTIPILMNNIQDAQFKTAYKKAYSVAAQAWQSAYVDNMIEPRSAGFVYESSNDDNYNQFMSKFDIIKTCNGPNKSTLLQCWADNETLDTWWGAPFTEHPAQVCFIDKSGMSWCNVATWPEILLDTNGLKSPNRFGIDRFILFPQLNDTNFSTTGVMSTAGIPNILRPSGDWISQEVNRCPYGNNHPCYYTKWLYN